MNAGPIRRVALIGFGEAGSILGADLRARGAQVCCYDILVQDEATAAALRARAAAADVRACATLAEALADAELVISAVTASADLPVAEQAGALLGAGQLFLDINSVSPDSKRAAAASVERSGAHYIEAAVMAPIPPQRLATPMLLGGALAAVSMPRLNQLGLNARFMSERVGVASAMKMCRSIMIKGLEALTVECLLAARRLGAEEAVLESLAQTYPGMGWRDGHDDYLVSRVAEHGRRRAAEMREVVATLEGIGHDPLLAAATAQRQLDLVERMAAAGIAYPRDRAFSWRELADALERAGSSSLGATSKR